MTNERDPLEDFAELSLPERNHVDRVKRIKQIIAAIRAEHLAEKEPK